jgi:glutathione S-transferase
VVQRALAARENAGPQGRRGGDFRECRDPGIPRGDAAAAAASVGATAARQFGSATLNDIAGLYSASDEASFAAKAGKLTEKFARLERRLGRGPYFDGNSFSLVDAVFGPVFRYFDVFDRIGDFGVLAGKPKVTAWREKLAARSSIRAAVAGDYNARLWAFLHARKSHISGLMAKA